MSDRPSNESSSAPAAAKVPRPAFGLVILTRWEKARLFCSAVAKSFVSNRCPVRASALAYSNLLALVPVLAVALSVTSSLLKDEGTERIEKFIQQVAAKLTPESKSAFGQLQSDPKVQEARKQLAAYIDEFIQNTRSGTLGVTGMVALLAVGIGMLVRIEDTFNDIWGIQDGRSWFSRIVLYWAALTLGPILLVAVIALTGSSHIGPTREYLSHLPLGVGPLLTVGFRALPFLILIVAFAVFYKIMPHTPVDWPAAFIGGIVGGTLWQLNNLLSVFYASRVVTNSYIYGSIGLVPVVMIGLYLSWLIMLFGAQVGYVFQNRRVCFQEKQLQSLNHAAHEWVAFQVMMECAMAFRDGKAPPTSLSLAKLLSLPSRLVARVVQPLLGSRLLAELTHPVQGLVPGRPIEAITAHDVLSAMRVGTGDDPALADHEGGEALRRQIAPIRQAEEASAKAVSLSALMR
ncbi:MAG: YihY/virulence factor BrkB family protein [Verrucomicrobia bacterium]|nr:YihY/virulence factor BrkB family protein [Verrucomicrobiota bacterium]